MILTGPSHSGKTSVALRLLETLPRPVAYLSLDDLVERSLRGTDPDPWKQIPLAYRLLEAEAEILLAAGWTVLLESTFTYVPSSGPGELHLEAIDSLLRSARKRGAQTLVVRLLAPEEALDERAAATARLPREIVRETARLHLEAGLEAHELDTSSAPPASIVAEIEKLLRAGSADPGSEPG